jgi:uncharacterized damage-inducible protein DinB
MAYTLDDVITEIQHSRAFFLRHLNGVAAEQWDWKPYPECKTIRDTVIHVLGTDDWTVQCLAEGVGPEAFFERLTDAATRLADRSPEELVALVTESRERIYADLRQRHGASPLDAPVFLWGDEKPLGSAVSHFGSEDYYHAGQIAFIRMATDPTWNYYADIYGG